MSVNRFSSLASSPNSQNPFSKSKPKEYRSASQSRPGNRVVGRDGFTLVKRVERKPKKGNPKAVDVQLSLREKHRYKYKVLSDGNGNVENNSTLYLRTDVAHQHQLEYLFANVIDEAKNMPHIFENNSKQSELSQLFGENFDCTATINLVRDRNGVYLRHAFVDLDNPKLYYVLIGCNPDGSERAEYIDDPDWVPPPTVETSNTTDSNAADWCWADEPVIARAPKIRKQLPPLLTLGKYEYDEGQQEHLCTEEKYGSVGVSPAFITAGIREGFDDCTLFVYNIPEDNPRPVTDFLYTIFARYARSSSSREDKGMFFPFIKVNQSDRGITATVEYAHHHDAKFALVMLKKIRANYNGKDVEMSVRNARHHT